MKINQRVLDSTELLIKKIAAETAALVASGAKLVNMSQGVPCLPIFDEAQSAIIEAVQSKQLPYTDVTGMLSVRQTCASFVNQFYSNDTVKMHFDASNIVVTAGAIQAICNVLSMTVDCADDVVMTTLPAYGLYIHQTRMLGGTFAALPTNAASGFVPTAADVRSFFRQFDVPATATAPARNRVRAVVLCFPNNPTGAMLTREQAKELAEALDAELRADPQGFALILDEVYLGAVFN
jgi:aspartate/methionine/tyrosine aminotransferase